MEKLEEDEESIMIDFKTWRSHRTMMFADFCVGAFVIGIILTIFFQTEYFYLRDTVKVNDPDLYYGLSTFFLCSSGASSSIFVSYYADKTRNIRRICIITSCISLTGSVMYTLYYSPALFLIGQFLIGTIGARSVAMMAEISRVYDKSDLSYRISIIIFFKTIGCITGPLLVLAFEKVNATLGNWTLSIGNLPGVGLAILLMVLFIIDFFILRNVSKEFDLLPASEKSQCSFHAEAMEETQQLSFLRYVSTIRSLLISKQILFMFILVLVACFTRSVLFLLQPVKFHEYLEWKQAQLAIINIISILFGGVLTAIALTFITKRVKEFYILIFSLCTIILSVVSMIVIPYCGKHIAKVAAVYSNTVLLLSFNISFNTAVRPMVLQFVPREIRTITEAIRNMLFEMCYVFAGASFKLFVSHTLPCLISLIVFILSIGVWFIINRDDYIHIKMIDASRFRENGDYECLPVREEDEEEDID